MELEPNDVALNSEAGCGILIAGLFPISHELRSTHKIMAKKEGNKAFLLEYILIYPNISQANYKL
jgi:hypothetical protein